MKWLCLTLTLFPLLTGCAYEQNYRAYAVAQSSMAAYNTPLVEFGCDGKVKSIGNPLFAYAMMQMKPPSSEADAFFSWLTSATPFGVLWGVVGSLANGIRGNTTNVNGSGNWTGNIGADGNLWNSPTTTTTTTTTMMPGQTTE